MSDQLDLNVRQAGEPKSISIFIARHCYDYIISIHFRMEYHNIGSNVDIADSFKVIY